MNWFHYLHARIWYSIEMALAYLAYHRGEKVLAGHHEANAQEYERRLRVMEINV